MRTGLVLRGAHRARSCATPAETAMTSSAAGSSRRISSRTIRCFGVACLTWPREGVVLADPGPDVADEEPLRNETAYLARADLTVAYCGTIGLAHGLEVVLRAGAALRARARRDVVFLLVGDGARLEALRAAAAAAGLDNVVFTGGLDRRSIPAVLACSDAVLVHLRAAEVFRSVMPSKILEGAAMGRPLVLGVRGFAQRFVEEAGCGVCVAPEDADGLAAAVTRLADDPALCRRLGRAGLACAARFDRDRLAARYLDIIERTVRRQHRPRVAARTTRHGGGCTTRK